MGSSSLPNGLLSLSFAACLLVHLFPFGFGASAAPNDPFISYHNGPLLTGNVSLAILWYGGFTPVEKIVLHTFIESLGVDRSLSFQPDVYTWWRKVDGYREIVNKKTPEGVVQVARETDDESASLGYVLGKELLPDLLNKTTVGLANTVAVIFVSKEVKMQDTCNTPCYLHGVFGKQVYMVVGNPEEECPGSCAVPFHRSRIPGLPPTALTLEPPSGNVGADAMVIHFASALAETVTNPFSTGFFAGEPGRELEVARVCLGLFATGALPGYPGNVRVDPSTGGAFNAHGLHSSKFLLPALWDPKSQYCWTIL